MNICFLDLDSVGKVDTLSCLEKFGKLTTYPNSSRQNIIPRIKGQHILITNKVVIDQEIMDQAPDLKMICIAATGMNNVDLNYAAQKNIPVKNVSGYSSESVAQFTFGMLFHLLHQNEYYNHYVKSGAYSQSVLFTHIGPEFWQLKGKTWGIIGLGAIGEKVANLAQAFGCKILYYSTSGLNNHPVYRRMDLDQLLSTSDVVSIHAPLNQQTLGLINYQKLRLMKPSAYLLNLGRGGIIDEKDLTTALNEGLLAGAGLDVLNQEPMAKDNPLFNLKDQSKIFITPHVAWSSLESRNLLISKICRHIEEFLKVDH